MDIEYSIIFPMVFKCGMEIKTWIKVDEVTSNEGSLQYDLGPIGIWSDRRDKFVSPSKQLQTYIENELGKYPVFIENMEELTSCEAQSRLERHQDYLYEMERDRRIGL